MGYGIIEVTGNDIKVVHIDALKLPPEKDNYRRLQMIHQRVTELMSLFKPDEFAIEAPFFGKNVQSMMKLGRAQGVAIAAAMAGNIPVTEYSPKKVKQSITGNGNADKDQVWQMLQRITSVADKPKYFDATDALAVAVCHHFSLQRPFTKQTTVAKRAKKSSSWEKFIAHNPGRIS